MLNKTINSLAASVSALLLIACGGNEPATPEQRNAVITVVETAANHLRESKRFRELPDAKIPEIPRNGGDAYSTPDKELRLVDSSLTAVVRDKEAEVLFTITIPKDSGSGEQREALVRLVREGGKWRGSEAVVVE